jgi:hypothetical protein
MDCMGIRWSLPSKGMAQTHLCNPFDAEVDGGGALLKSLRKSCLILLIYVVLRSFPSQNMHRKKGHML